MCGAFLFATIPVPTAAARICYAPDMQDYDLPQHVIDELIRLSNEVGTPIEDRPEFQVLWDERLIMGGDKKRVHITQRGVAWLERRGFIKARR